MNAEQLLFFVFSATALLGALGVVLLRDPVKGAMSLIASFFSLACLFLLQSAETLAVLQVMVYAGAIMVLFVFVIMLVEHHDEPILPKQIIRRIFAILSVAFVVWTGVALGSVVMRTRFGEGEVLPEGFGSPRTIGMEFFTNFLFQFELASILLLIAIVGAVMISRKSP